MAIYDRPTRLIIRDMIAELAPSYQSKFSRSDALNWFAKNYPKIKEGTITAHLYRFSTNSPSRLSHPTRADEDILFQTDKYNFRLYQPNVDPTPKIADAKKIVSIENDVSFVEDVDDVDAPREFAYESDLKNFLAKNLTVIEPGLKLYQVEDINGIEFPADGRFIDILAIDSNNDLVVIELKVSKGHERVIGQILRYMAWIQFNQAESNQKVRGVIVAREISKDLKLACSYNPNIKLFEYQLSVSLNKIEMNYL